MNQPVLNPIYARASHRANAQISTYNIGQTAVKSTSWVVAWGMGLMIALLWWFTMGINTAEAADKRVVVLGDSLTAGYGLEGGQAFPEQLAIALAAEGMNVQVDNAGVSGDTTAGGLSRLAWAIDGTPKPNLVIIALGANDMLRGLPVADAKGNLGKILSQLRDKKIPALLAGMRAPAQYSLLFRGQFDAMYKELADEYDVQLYPFFLEGVALHPDLNQADGMHPNSKGVAIMVKNMTPVVKELLDK